MIERRLISGMRAGNASGIPSFSLHLRPPSSCQERNQLQSTVDDMEILWYKSMDLINLNNVVLSCSSIRDFPLLPFLYFHLHWFPSHLHWPAVLFHSNLFSTGCSFFSCVFIPLHLYSSSQLFEVSLLLAVFFHVCWFPCIFTHASCSLMRLSSFTGRSFLSYVLIPLHLHSCFLLFDASLFFSSSSFLTFALARPLFYFSPFLDVIKCFLLFFLSFHLCWFSFSRKKCLAIQLHGTGTCEIFVHSVAWLEI